MVERMVWLTFRASNVYGVIDDKSNYYRNIIMDAMRMNQGRADQCLIVDEKSNADLAKSFYLLKDFNEPL